MAQEASVPDYNEVPRMKRVMLVEDEPVDRLLFEDSLKSIY